MGQRFLGSSLVVQSVAPRVQAERTAARVRPRRSVMGVVLGPGRSRSGLPRPPRLAGPGAKPPAARTTELSHANELFAHLESFSQRWSWRFVRCLRNRQLRLRKRASCASIRARRRRTAIPILTTVVEVAQSKRVSDATASCAALTRQRAARLHEPGAREALRALHAVPLPGRRTRIFTVTVEGNEYPGQVHQSRGSGARASSSRASARRG